MGTCLKIGKKSQYNSFELERRDSEEFGGISCVLILPVEDWMSLLGISCNSPSVYLLGHASPRIVTLMRTVE